MILRRIFEATLVKEKRMEIWYLFINIVRILLKLTEMLGIHLHNVQDN